MAGLRMFEDQLQIMTPHSYVALQRLVAAMADYVNNAGKTTFFGRDKGQQAYAKFLAALRQTCHAMIVDKVVRESSTEEELLNALTELLRKFSLAFPNWQEAYAFAADLLGPRRSEALTLVARLRSSA